MSRRCELTGKGVMSGNNVSHAKNRTRRTFRPNLCNVTLASDILGRSFKLKVSAAALRSVDHNGGLDVYIEGLNDDGLSLRARRIKRDILKAKSAEVAVA